MKTATDIDGRDKDAVISEQQDRIEALMRRVSEQEERIGKLATRTVELFAENQVLTDALAQARWSIQEAVRIIQ